MFARHRCDCLTSLLCLQKDAEPPQLFLSGLVRLPDSAPPPAAFLGAEQLQHLQRSLSRWSSPEALRVQPQCILTPGGGDTDYL